MCGACDEPSAAGEAPAQRVPEAKAPKETTPGEDPLLRSVCTAFDEVQAEGVDRPLMHAAVRAVDNHGVTEAELAELGGTPDKLLSSIKARGNPKVCTGMVAALKAMP